MLINCKRLLKNIINQFYYPSLFYKNVKPSLFPNQPLSNIKIKARLRSILSELKQRKISYNLGVLYGLPHPSAADVYKKYIDYNPGNLGDWSSCQTKKWSTTQLEYEVIHKMIDLYKGNHQKLAGYITSGGTEGNIYALWLGRTHLEQYYKSNQICLLRTSLSHYSIGKAARLCNVYQTIVPLNPVSWNMDAKGLRDSIKKLRKKNYFGFIVPLTLGYTSTGTCDDVDSIIGTACQLKKRYKKIKFFFWIDAAFNGLINPFITHNFKPFNSPLVKAFIVDFHKFGLAPYPAGIILYCQSLKKLIQQPIDYLSEIDATLLGSRSGIPAISIWKMIHYLGKTGYQKIVKKQMENKIFFIEQLQQMSSAIEIITHPQSLSCGVIFHNLKKKRLPLKIEQKYNLYPGKTKLLFYPNKKQKQIIYKFYFLNHLKKKIITEFLSDIKSQ